MVSERGTLHPTLLQNLRKGRGMKARREVRVGSCLCSCMSMCWHTHMHTHKYAHIFHGSCWHTASYSCNISGHRAGCRARHQRETWKTIPSLFPRRLISGLRALSRVLGSQVPSMASEARKCPFAFLSPWPAQTPHQS